MIREEPLTTDEHLGTCVTAQRYGKTCLLVSYDTRLAGEALPMSTTNATQAFREMAVLAHLSYRKADGQHVSEQMSF